MDIQDYGAVPAAAMEQEEEPARVIAVHKGRYELACSRGAVYGRLKTGAYRDCTEENLPTVGDFVRVRPVPGGDSLILETLPRRTFLSRLDPSTSRSGQAVAANFDTACILQPIDRPPRLKGLERWLALAHQSGAAPAVLLTKADLAEDADACLRAVRGIAGGAPVIAVSVRTGQGLDALAVLAKPRDTLALIGPSGAGKSSLLNALAGEAIQPEGTVRAADGRGRHTTGRRLVRLPSGVLVIDTPGMREVGLWEAADGLDDAFADVEAHLGHCRFSDCRHQSEPGCAVKAAIAEGALSLERWESYCALQKEASRVAGAEGRRKEKKRPVHPADYRRHPCHESFTCAVCGAPVSPEGAGSGHRNHCPHCLSSLHVDNAPGDRASLCRGVMDPIGVWVRRDGEWAIIHRCRSCGALHSNRVAADDNPMLLLSIAVKPLASPPFPLGKLGQAAFQTDEK